MSVTFPNVVTYLGVSWLYGLITFPKFEATIVDVKSEMVEVEYTDDDGWTRTREELMHTPIVQFIDEQGQEVRLPTDISSGGKPRIGDTMKVAYKDGKLHEMSFGTGILLVGLALFISVPGYLLLLTVFYAFGWDSTPLLKFSGIAFFKGIVPLAMFGMLAAFVTAIFQTATGARRDLSDGAVVLCVLFSLALLSGLWVYLKTIFGVRDDP